MKIRGLSLHAFWTYEATGPNKPDPPVSLQITVAVAFIMSSYTSMEQFPSHL